MALHEGFSSFAICHLAAMSCAPQDTVSVHRPGFYAERFQRFMCNTVFKKIPCKWLLQDEPL